MNIEITNNKNPSIPDIHKYRSFHLNPANSQIIQLSTRATYRMFSFLGYSSDTKPTDSISKIKAAEMIGICIIFTFLEK